MKILLFSFIAFLSFPSFAQKNDIAVLTLTTNNTEKVMEKTKKPIFHPNIERTAHFLGGKKAFTEYVINHVVYPELALENAREGIVIVEFTVKKNGNIKNAKIVQRLGFGCDEVALELVKNMPKWKPALQGERAVRSRIRLPLSFYL